MRSTFSSTPGGVMTEEAGAITGDLELLTRPGESGGVEALVRYAGADEWYRVAGSPTGSHRGNLRRAHEAILARLTTPGPVVGGNERPADLKSDG